jgi:hypothetical protein
MKQYISTSTPNPQLNYWLRNAVIIGFALTMLLPWRSAWLGFTPLWLLAMPLSAWWALHRFRFPTQRKSNSMRRRRSGGQARRRSKPLIAKSRSHAA